MKRIVPILLALNAMAWPALGETIRPGYWESANHLSLIFDEDSTSRKCLTPALVDSYLTGPSNRHYTCTYDKRLVGDGHVRLSGECVDSNGIHMDVAVDGTYSPEQFHLKAKFIAHLGKLPIQGWATTDAHRISADCPAEADKPPPPPVPAPAPQ